MLINRTFYAIAGVFRRVAEMVSAAVVFALGSEPDDGFWIKLALFSALLALALRWQWQRIGGKHDI